MVRLICISILNIFILTCILGITFKKNHYDNVAVQTFLLLYILFFLIMLTNIYTIMFDQYNVFILVNFIFIIISFCISIIYSFKEKRELDKNKEKLVSEENSYKNLLDSYDNVKEFKHDFANILQSMKGYIDFNDLNGLKKYFNSILKDYNKLSILDCFNSDRINSPPVLAIISDKYKKAESLGINFHIEVYFDFNEIKMDIYEFTRILGIFLDNSIEAAKNSTDKIINIMIKKDFTYSRDLLIIENSYSDNKINIDKIYEKNFSTKKGNSGIGLCKVQKIIKKHHNLSLNTFVNKKLFTQQLEIY